MDDEPIASGDEDEDESRDLQKLVLLVTLSEGPSVVPSGDVEGTTAGLRGRVVVVVVVTIVVVTVAVAELEPPPLAVELAGAAAGAFVATELGDTIAVTTDALVEDEQVEEEPNGDELEDKMGADVAPEELVTQPMPP